MRVIIRRSIHSNAPAEPGTWSIEVERDLIAIPRAGDFIELAEGYHSTIVKETTFMANGRVIVSLLPLVTNSPNILINNHKLVDDHGWKWTGRYPERA